MISLKRVKTLAGSSPVAVWRLQRDRVFGDVVACMTKDRTQVHFVVRRRQKREFTELIKRMGTQPTVYVRAFLSGGRLVVRETVDRW